MSFLSYSRAPGESSHDGPDAYPFSRVKRVSMAAQCLTCVLLVLLPELAITSRLHPVRASGTQQVYWGALIGGSTYGPGYSNAPYDTTTWNLFEAHAGKKVSMLHWPLPWYASKSGGWQTFPTANFNTVRNRGAIPFVSWSSLDLCCGTNEPAFALRNIVNGATYSYGGQTFDQYITSWATAAKTWGHPFFLRFDQEMNGWWQFPWATAPNPNTGIINNNNTPQDYVNAWQHVHDIFTRVGATNVTWVWCPNLVIRGRTTPLSQLYPGDAFVDWTGLDGYNNAPTNWQTFAQVFNGDSSNGFQQSYSQILSFVPTKPLMIGETASVETGDGGAKKADWITDALLTQLPSTFPQVKAVMWFNQYAAPSGSFPGRNYPIESSMAAQNAFANGIASSYYASNTFASLNTSPVPPLS